MKLKCSGNEVIVLGFLGACGLDRIVEILKLLTFLEGISACCLRLVSTLTISRCDKREKLNDKIYICKILFQRLHKHYFRHWNRRTHFFYKKQVIRNGRLTFSKVKKQPYPN